MLGRVVGLWRYPVKSMGPEPLAEVDVSWNGLAGDRRWAFVREGQVRSGFPWLTIRERPEMHGYAPSTVDPARADGSPVVVRTPTGATLDVADPALAAELGHGARVLKNDRGLHDTMPLSLMTTATLATLGARVGSALDVRRFRPNLLVDAGEGDWPEDAWVGSVLRIGGAWIRIDKRDQRCVMVNVDPDTAERDPAILRAIARDHEACLGVYGSTVRPGRVAIGDPVFLEPAFARGE